MGTNDNCDTVLRSSKGHCYGNQLIIDIAKFTWLNPPSLCALAFQNELVYRNTDMPINNHDDRSISCENLVNLGQ